MIEKAKLEIKTHAEFDKTFSSLKRMRNTIPGAKNAFELLKNLNQETSTLQSDLLVSEIHKIEYQSNTNSYFYFYFPIVSYILYYKPQYQTALLNYLVGPNFANGISEVDEMILVIKEVMEFKLKEDPFYLTKESQFWILNELSQLEKEIEREIDFCSKELEE